MLRQSFTEYLLRTPEMLGSPFSTGNTAVSKNDRVSSLMRLIIK